MGEFLVPEVAKNDKTVHQQKRTSDTVGSSENEMRRRQL